MFPIAKAKNINGLKITEICVTTGKELAHEK